ncbi:MAG: VOC family protein [Hyphomicrobiaceae bacterium]
MSTQHPISIQGIDHVVIRANKIDRLIAFYRDVLNCQLEREIADLGLYQLRAGAALIDIVDAHGKIGRQSGGPPDPAAANMDHLCVQVAPWDAETIAEHLRSHGVEPGDVVTRYGANGNGPSIYISDPEGNSVELKGPPDGT